MNSASLTSNQDIGEDGLTGGFNQFIARDAIGFNLNYYDTADYSPINTNYNPFPGTMAFYQDPAEYRPLFNGNISSIAVHNRALTGSGIVGGPLMLYNYRYDQLNRLVAMDAYNKSNLDNNDWAGLTRLTAFKEGVKYDGNGNILQYSRNGHKISAVMDSLSYFYLAGTNKLAYVRDSVAANRYGLDSNDVADIDNQSSGNYTYDEIGNLVKDNAEGITDIRWSVYGKILQITRLSSTTNPIEKIVYSYDGQGNRISKTIKRNNGKNSYTWYVRDAQGNVMTTYESVGSGTDLAALPLKLSERHLYGSSRLGMYTKVVDVDNAPKDMRDSNSVRYYRGYRQYELSNHLGNVLATISDKKRPVADGSGSIAYYDADVVMAQDYYPFGMLMPGRTGRLNNGNWSSGPGSTPAADSSLLSDLAIDSRVGNQPPEYKATRSIELLSGFESGVGDNFTAFISTDPGGGSSTAQPGSGGEPDGSGYRYGFNGKENDDEVKGEGNSQDYGMRIYDPRLGRFLSTDPITKDYPDLTPYQFASNSPVAGNDLDGEEFNLKIFSPASLNITMSVVQGASEYSKQGKSPYTGAVVGAFKHYGAAVAAGGLALDWSTGGNITRYGATLFTIWQASEVYEYTNRNTNQKNQTLRSQNETAAKGAMVDIAVGYVTGKFAGATFNSIRAIVTRRINLANDFYKAAGYADDAVRSSHLNGIAFEEAVQTTTLKEGTVINQWVNTKRGVGDYFTTGENTAQNLGMDDYGDRVLTQFKLTKDVKVLKSTAADYQGAEGGGTQYFSSELKSNVKEIKTMPNP